MSDERPRHATIRHPDGSTAVAGVRYADDSLRDDAPAMLDLLGRLHAAFCDVTRAALNGEPCPMSFGDANSLNFEVIALVHKHGRSP